MQSSLVVAFHLLVLALVLTEQSQIVQLLGYVWVVCSQNLGGGGTQRGMKHQPQHHQLWRTFLFYSANPNHLYACYMLKMKMNVNKKHVYIGLFSMCVFVRTRESKQQMYRSLNSITDISHLLSDLQSSFTKGLCVLVFSSFPIKHCQVVQRCCHLSKDAKKQRSNKMCYKTANQHISILTRSFKSTASHQSFQFICFKT